jgi:hypothetical protein
MSMMVADSRAHNTRVLQRTRSACPPLVDAVLELEMPASECQARRSSQIVYRDTNHLTASFVTGLLPELAPALQWVRQ